VARVYISLVNYTKKAGVLALSLAALTSAAFAGQLTGTWHGHIKINMASMPANMPAAQKEQAMKSIKMTESMVVNLTLKADHTFVVTMTGMPKAAGKSPQNEGGTWSQSGSTVSIQGVKDGKKMGNPQVFTLAKDGKSFSMVQKNPMTKQDAATVIFTR